MLIVEVQLCQLAARIAECHEVCHLLRNGYAGQRFAQVVGEAVAVVLGVEQALDIIEDVFLCQVFCPAEPPAHFL